jgi:hypothetical protein
MIERIISGGQTGVDQAALRAALRLGIPTGGWAPRGWQMLDGAAPWLAEYGLVEHEGGYAARTDANVRDSDATLRVARDFLTPGERCTMSAIARRGRPHLDLLVGRGGVVSLLDDSSRGGVFVADALRLFLARHRVRVLNVAGNSERAARGIGVVVEEFLVGALVPP